jgi:hypothetical protein
MPKFATTFTVGTKTDTALYRAELQAIHDAVAAVLVQTDEPGQLDISTATPSSSVGDSVGYESFQFNDTLQDTEPLYVKVDYPSVPSGAGGTNSTNSISALRHLVPFVTVGTMSGPLTYAPWGAADGSTATSWGLSSVSAAAGQSLPVVSASGDGWVVVAGGFRPVTSSSEATRSWLIGIERPRENGAPVGGGVAVIGGVGVNTGSSSLYGHAASVVTSLTSGTHARSSSSSSSSVTLDGDVIPGGGIIPMPGPAGSVTRRTPDGVAIVSPLILAGDNLPAWAAITVAGVAPNDFGTGMTINGVPYRSLVSTPDPAGAIVGGGVGYPIIPWPED